MKTMTTILLTLFTASLAFAETSVGRFPAGERYEAPAAHAPANTSRMFVRIIDKAGDVNLPAAGDSGMIIWTIPIGNRTAAAKVSSALTTPTGASLKAGDAGSIERGLRRFKLDAAEIGLDLPRGQQEVLHVMQAEAASYKLRVDLPDGAAGVLVVAAEPDSSIAMNTWAAPLSRQPGQPVTLHADLTGGITGAKVTARLASPNGRASAPIELTDNGDGTYSAMLAELPDDATGVWQVRFDADGRTADDVRFSRTGSGELVAERAIAKIVSTKAVRDGEVLRVTASVDVAVAGMYRFDAIIAGAADEAGSRAALAWGENGQRFEAGTHELMLELPANGAAIADIRLIGLDPVGVAGQVTLAIE
jgi:hypothetical protein